MSKRFQPEVESLKTVKMILIATLPHSVTAHNSLPSALCSASTPNIAIIPDRVYGYGTQFPADFYDVLNCSCAVNSYGISGTSRDRHGFLDEWKIKVYVTEVKVFGNRKINIQANHQRYRTKKTEKLSGREERAVLAVSTIVAPNQLRPRSWLPGGGGTRSERTSQALPFRIPHFLPFVQPIQFEMWGGPLDGQQSPPNLTMALKLVAFSALIAVARAGYAAPAYAAPAYAAHAYAAPAYAAPAYSHAYAAPAVAKYVAPVAKYAAPVAYAAAPAYHAAPAYAPAYAAKAVVDEYDPHPQYSFAYDIQDAHTGDYKSQHESRDGDVVHGSYSLVEPDGSKRTVEYTADPHNGFNAVVHKEAGAHPVAYAAPVAKYAAPVAYAPVAKYAAPVAKYAAPAYTTYAAPVAKYAAPAYGYAAPVAKYAAPAYASYAAPAYAYGHGYH
ncbi:hypothetical protein J6590_036924 [Homalodisca vitripennis]|nr:hypothetical protein J6590_036924 [Homalodisca vitripennis]